MRRRALFIGTTLLLYGGIVGASCGTDCEDVTIYLAAGEYGLARLECSNASRTNLGDFKIEGGSARGFITPVTQVYYSPDQPDDPAYLLLVQAGETAGLGEYDLDYSLERNRNGDSVRLAGTAKVVIQAPRSGGARLVLDPPAAQIAPGGSTTVTAKTADGTPYVADGRKISWVSFGFDASTSKPAYVSGAPTEPFGSELIVGAAGLVRAIGVDPQGGITLSSSTIEESANPTEMFVSLPADLPDSAARGSRVTITANVGNASGDVTFEWVVNGQPFPDTDNSIELIIDETKVIRVTATDGAGHVDTDEHTITVQASAYSVSIVSNPRQLPNPIPRDGVDVEFRAEITGGVAPFTYAWSAQDAQIQFSAPTAEVTTARLYREANINLAVTDARGEVLMAPTLQLRRPAGGGDFTVIMNAPPGLVYSNTVLSLVPREYNSESMQYVDACMGYGEGQCSYEFSVVEPSQQVAEYSQNYPLAYGPGTGRPLTQGIYTFRAKVVRGALQSNTAEVVINVQ